MKFVLATISFCFLLMGSSACNKEKVGPVVMNNSIFFVLKQNNVRLADNILDGLKLSYPQGGSKKYVSDFIRGTGDGYGLGVMTTRSVGTISSDESVKEYFLEFPNGTTDTVFIDYRHLNFDAAAAHPCYCYYPLEEVKFNGQVASPDPEITQQKVYRFNLP